MSDTQGNRDDKPLIGDADDIVDKAKHTGEEMAGKAKEAAGKATGDEELEAKGKAEKSAGSLKKAGDKLKEAFRR